MTIADAIVVSCCVLAVAYLAGVIAQLQHKAWVLRWERQERALMEDFWNQTIAKSHRERQARSGN